MNKIVFVCVLMSLVGCADSPDMPTSLCEDNPVFVEDGIYGSVFVEYKKTEGTCPYIAIVSNQKLDNTLVPENCERVDESHEMCMAMSNFRCPTNNGGTMEYATNVVFDDTVGSGYATITFYDVHGDEACTGNYTVTMTPQ